MRDTGLVIFDCDGVLVDSELIALGVLSARMNELGHPMDVPACRDAFMGLHIGDIVREMGRRLGHTLPADEAERQRTAMLARMERELQPVAGVAAALARLDGPRCVGSSSDRARIKLTLHWTGLAAFFGDAIFSGFDVPNGKPAPDLFLHAARAMDVAPARCTVIEDSAAGVTAGIAAGMRVIGFTGGSHTTPGHRAWLRAAGAHDVIASMDRLETALAASSSV